MVEDQARIIETKGTVHPQPAVDIIVSVADNVPSSMYLDETYTFRVRSILHSPMGPYAH